LPFAFRFPDVFYRAARLPARVSFHFSGWQFRAARLIVEFYLIFRFEVCRIRF
jgi:hypothetical protein